MISVDELWNSGKYNLVRELKYQDIVQFVFETIKLRNSSTYWYFGYNILTLVLLAYFSISAVHSGSLLFKTVFLNFIWGSLCGSFLIIPVHELIHGLVYLLIGAPRIFFGADFKQMIFFVASDKYVTDRKAFFMVALAPFIFINLVLIFITIFLNIKWIIFMLSLLLFHNIMCIGDFAMVSFFLQNRDSELYTYDDHKERISYIFEKKVSGLAD